MSSSEVVDVFEDKKGKLFLKTFLVNSDLNLAKWRIHPDYIPKHVEKFVGRPFILTQERGHPLEFERAKIDWNNINDSIGGLLQAQEKYRIGTIRKVEAVKNFKNQASASERQSSSVWAAYVEITDPNAAQAFKSGHIPRYVSPAVFRLNQTESPETTTDFEPLHLAAVDIPAYGYQQAGIRGSCEGDIVSCSNALAAASAPVEEVGFCVKGVLDGFQNTFTNSSLVLSGVKQASVNLSVNSTSTDSQPQAQPQQQQQQQQTQQPPPTQPVANNNTTPQTPSSQILSNIPQQPGIPQPRPEGAPFEVPKVEAKDETKPAPGNLPGQLGPSPNASNNNDDKTKQDEVATLRATVEALLSRVKELDSFKAESEKTTAEKLLAAKRSKIEAVIPSDYAKSKEERNKAIEALMRFEDGPQLDYILEKFVTPTTAPPINPLLPLDGKEKRGLKQAGFSESITKRVPSKRLSDYAAVPNAEQATTQPAIQQASIDQAAILKRAARIVAMSDIVANSQYSGGF